MGTTGYFLSDGTTDLDSVFEPGTASPQSSYPRADNGQPLAYAPLSEGSAAAATGYYTAGDLDFSALWAAKGSVAYLANPQTWTQVNYQLAPAGGSLPSYALMPMVSSMYEADHMSIVVRLTFNPDGTWTATVASTNRTNDYWWYYNSYLGQYLTTYNPNDGDFTTSFQHGTTGTAGQLSAATTFSGNWLETVSSGAGANYQISASFSSVYDYTATAGSLTGAPWTWAQGLRGATSGMSIACNGGFVVDSSGTVHSSVSGMSLANPVSLCYEWNSSGGFGGNLAGFEGANGVLNWVLYTVATVTLSNLSGSASASGTLALGAAVNWVYFDNQNPPPPHVYPGGKDLDGTPWTTANIGAGSQGQWNYGGTSGGGGGGGGCVVVGAECFNGQLAGSFTTECDMLVTDAYGDGSHFGHVEYSEAKLQPCVAVRTRQGAYLEMSVTAPIPTQDHSYVLAADLKGEYIPIADEAQFESFRAEHGYPMDLDIDWTWDEVVDVEDIGMKWVQHLTIGHHHHCFWARSDGRFFILHHNLKPIKSAQ